MLEGQQEGTWAVASALLAWIGNCSPRRPAHKVYRAADFNPMIKPVALPLADIFAGYRAVADGKEQPKETAGPEDS